MEKTLREKISDVAKKAGRDIVDTHESMDEKDLARIIEKSIFVSIGEFTIELGKEKPPKSKFMEEWNKCSLNIETKDHSRLIGNPVHERLHSLIYELALLIDKYKADKEEG